MLACNAIDWTTTCSTRVKESIVIKPDSRFNILHSFLDKQTWENILTQALKVKLCNLTQRKQGKHLSINATICLIGWQHQHQINPEIQVFHSYSHDIAYDKA